MADYNLGPFRIRPMGTYDSTTSYRFLDAVTYKGGSYLCLNEDTIDGTACVGILPTGDSSSEAYWMLLAEKGDTMTASDYEYSGFVTVSDMIWDYDTTDKIIIPETSSGTLTINNAYDGCCGLIVTKSTEVGLPSNSCTSVDFNYATLMTNQLYMYSFVCCNYGYGNMFLWNRTVIDE